MDFDSDVIRDAQDAAGQAPSSTPRARACGASLAAARAACSGRSDGRRGRAAGIAGGTR